MDKFQKHDAQPKKTDLRGYIMYDSILHSGKDKIIGTK